MGKHQHGVHMGTSSISSSYPAPPKPSLVLSSCAAAWLGFFLPFLRGVPPPPLSVHARVCTLGCILARRARGPRCSCSTLLITAASGNGAVLVGGESPQPPELCWGAGALLVPLVPRRGADWAGGQLDGPYRGPGLGRAVTACLLLSRPAAVPARLCLCAGDLAAGRKPAGKGMELGVSWLPPSVSGRVGMENPK